MVTGSVVANLPAGASGTARRTLSRQFWVIAHRWAGLSLTLFLAMAGFTGIFLSWLDELEVATAPELHLAAPPSPDARPLEVLAIREQVLARYPGAEIDFVPLRAEPGRSLRLHLHWHDPKTGKELEAGPGWDDLFLDPYTGRELGRREWGNITQGVKNLMPFVYRLHYSLAMGRWATIVFGVAALVWTIDCFVGFYLTLPVRQRRPSGQSARASTRPQQPSWWQRWKPSWKIRWGASRYKFNFDLHRAGGLWIWPLLLVFAWSSVSFNLPQVYAPVMKQFGAVDARAALFATKLPSPREHPALSFDQALRHGRALSASEAGKRGLVLRDGGEGYLWHVPAVGAYVYAFTTSADIAHDGGGTRVAFDSNSGAIRAFQAPTGENGANTVTTWITNLHMAHVLGMPWRIAVSVVGALVTALCVTGMIIWMRKRSARTAKGDRVRTPSH
jgi:uncharacterized iron-regulated membrane protein